jgi:hypothetical protein
MSYNDDVLLDEILNPFHRPGQGWYQTKEVEEKSDKDGIRINKKIHRNADGDKSISTRSPHL